MHDCSGDIYAIYGYRTIPRDLLDSEQSGEAFSLLNNVVFCF